MSKQENVGTSQLRSFGLLMGSVFAVIALWPTVWHGGDLRMWALIVAAAIVIPALAVPTTLRPIYRLWMRIGYMVG